MAATNDFQPFGASGGANVVTQAAYISLLAGSLANGFQPGVAASNQFNKVWRQSSLMANIIGALIVQNTGQNVIDDGSTATILANLSAALSVSSVPKTNGAATYTMVLADTDLIANYAGIQTVTLLNPVNYPGKEVVIKTITANTVVSASANVVPQVGGAAATAILAATAGKWARLKSDGANWIIMSSN